ncbi:MAG: response regulator transcription factor [Gemmatimonadaceae bacterium]|nr:response regulator transcription factor [Gemmatimonadaceae bacterium]
MIRRVLIADDEPLARERLADLLREHAPQATVRDVGNGQAALELISAWAPDLLLLDIQMPGRTGLDVVAALDPAHLPLVVFITAHDEHAVQAFELAAVDYLLKPYDDARFAAMWRRVEERRTAGLVVEHARLLGALAGNSDGAPRTSAATPRYIDRIVIKQDQRTRVVMLQDVQWMESDGNYVRLHAGKDVYQVRETLSSLESRLDPRRFLRIHRRTIVDMRAMKEMQPWFGGDLVMILKDGTKLRVGRSLRANVTRRIAGDL